MKDIKVRASFLMNPDMFVIVFSSWFFVEIAQGEFFRDSQFGNITEVKYITSFILLACIVNYVRKKIKASLALEKGYIEYANGTQIKGRIHVKNIERIDYRLGDSISDYRSRFYVFETKKEYQSSFRRKNDSSYQKVKVATYYFKEEDIFEIIKACLEQNPNIEISTSLDDKMRGY